MEKGFKVGARDGVKDASGADVKLIELSGKMDLISSPNFTEKVLPFIEEGSIFFILDMSKLDYIDSAGIYALLQCYTRVKEKKGYLKLLKVNKNILEILSSIGVTKILSTYDELSDALKG